MTDLERFGLKQCIICRKCDKSIGHLTDCMKNRICDKCLGKDEIKNLYENSCIPDKNGRTYYPSNQEIKEYVWLAKTGRI